MAIAWLTVRMDWDARYEETWGVICDLNHMCVRSLAALPRENGEGGGLGLQPRMKNHREKS